MTNPFLRLHLVTEHVGVDHDGTSRELAGFLLRERALCVLCDKV